MTLGSSSTNDGISLRSDATAASATASTGWSCSATGSAPSNSTSTTSRTGASVTFYLILRGKGITRVISHHVPELVRFDDSLLAVEMTIAAQPFLLDFAGAYPADEAPDFPPEVWAEWTDEKAEQFGERLAEVLRLRDEFARLTGYVIMDINPKNITFE